MESSPSKQIESLVPDIYALLGGESPLSEEDVDGIAEEIKRVLKMRLVAKKEARKTLSMSSVGSACWRQLWYKEHKPELLEELPPHTKLKFMYGDIIECLLLGLAKATGHKVTGEQDTLELHGVEGHRDAVIDGVTVDVKSANSRSFLKFKNHELDKNDPFGYRDQLSCYVEAAEDGVDKTRGAFLALDQELGHIVLDVYDKRSKDYKKQIEEMQAMLAKDTPPPRPFEDEEDGKSGNKVIPLNCRYCVAKEDCWKDVNNGRGLLKYVYSNGPRWFTRVVREPNPKVREF
jgi:uncharacterized FlaG/YvyC family protein